MEDAHSLRWELRVPRSYWVNRHLLGGEPALGICRRGWGGAGHAVLEGPDPPLASPLSNPRLPPPEQTQLSPAHPSTPQTGGRPGSSGTSLPPALAAYPGRCSLTFCPCSSPCRSPLKPCHDDACSEGPEPCGSLGMHVAPDTRLCPAPRQTCPALHHEALPWAGTPLTAFQLSPMLGKLVGDSVAVWMRLAPSLLAAQGRGVGAWWVRMSLRAQLRSWLCSDPRGTLTFGTSGSRLAKWES